MRRFPIAFHILAAVFVFSSFAQIAAAQTGVPQGGEKGLLNAVAYLPITKGQAIAVSSLSDSVDDLALKKTFEQTLRAAGYSLSADATLILTFEVRNEIGAWSETGRRHVLELTARGGGAGGDNAKALLNLYDTNRGGVFNRGSSGTSIVTPSKYRIDAQIDDRTNGKRLWQAWATADLGDYNSRDLARAMIPELVKSLGRTVKRQTFAIP
jgi:hypothetical protein